MEDNKITEKSKKFIEKYDNNKNFKKYTSNFKKIIEDLPLGTVLSYVSPDNNDNVTFKVGGFLYSREDNYFMLRNVYQSKFISFPVQYNKLLILYVRDDIQIKQMKNNLQNIEKKNLEKNNIEKDYVIKIKDEIYKDFKNRTALQKHLKTNKFFLYSKNFDKKNIKFYYKNEEIKNIN